MSHRLVDPAIANERAVGIGIHCNAGKVHPDICDARARKLQLEAAGASIRQADLRNRKSRPTTYFGVILVIYVTLTTAQNASPLEVPHQP